MPVGTSRNEKVHLNSARTQHPVKDSILHSYNFWLTIVHSRRMPNQSRNASKSYLCPSVDNETENATEKPGITRAESDDDASKS